MLIPVHAPGVGRGLAATLPPGRSRPRLRTDKKPLTLACDLSLPTQT